MNDEDGLRATTSFVPGSSVAVVGPRTILLIDSTGGDDSTADVARLVLADRAVHEILDALARPPFEQLPSFALAQFDDDRAQLVVRGTYIGEIATTDDTDGADDIDDTVILDAHGVSTWTERIVEHARGVVLRPTGTAWTPSQFHVQSGIVPADAVARGRTRNVETEPPLSVGEPAATIAAGPRPSSEATLSVALFEASAVGAPTDEAEDDYDHLFGVTRARSVEEAAIRAAPVDGDVSLPGDAAGDGTGDRPGAPLPPPTPPAPLVAGAPPEPPALGPRAAPAVAARSFIDAVPNGMAAAPVPPSRPGDHDGMTISRAQLAATTGDVAPSGADGTGTAATILAVFCPHGHPNPTHANVCRLCGVSVRGDQPAPVLRPSLGVLRFNSGEVVELRRTLIIGRAPRVEGALTGNVPQLVKLPSPEQGISRLHAEVRVEGWNVVLTDLNSRNGTTVVFPGAAPIRLRAGEGMPIGPGVVVHLGDEASFVYEATP
jgi:hypothetical protein